MATVSGTVSEATGGKFANGAVSGAFVHMFNDESSRALLQNKGVPDSMGGNSSGNYIEARTKVATWLDKLADIGDSIASIGYGKKNLLLIDIGAKVSVAVTTLKIMIDPKEYQPTEIYNEYVPFQYIITSLK